MNVLGTGDLQAGELRGFCELGEHLSPSWKVPLDAQLLNVSLLKPLISTSGKIQPLGLIF